MMYSFLHTYNAWCQIFQAFQIPPTPNTADPFIYPEVPLINFIWKKIMLQNIVGILFQNFQLCFFLIKRYNCLKVPK